MKNLPIRFLYTMSIALSIILWGCNSKDKIQIELEKIAESLKKESPIQIDGLTRMDNCEALPKRTLKYSYTLLFDKNNRDTVAFREKAKPNIVYKIQTTPSVNYLLDNHVTFIYSYKDEYGNNWGQIVVTEEDYNKPSIKPKDIISPEDNIDEQILNNVASEIRKDLPIYFTETNITVMDCKALSGNTLEYTSMLNNEISSEFDSIQYKEEMYPKMLESLKTDPILITLLAKGVSMRYVYLDEDNKYLFTIKIPSSEN